MERMILARLKWYLDIRFILPSTMTRFRKNLCTSNTLLEFSCAADNAKKTRQALLAAFHDIKKAFDSVTPQVVVNMLQQVKITGRAIRFILGFLPGRMMQVRLGTTLSSTRASPVGLPQRSILRPVIFNIVMAGVTFAPSLTPPVHLSNYADDLTIWTTGRKFAHYKVGL
ncbi:uncharacterized protein LOC135387569 [Ornithodoros turicata]|uniref:uncharacterized protein LOC135387569 n=1 Tax=Ornithodoros turicata TaxID=34597 RepID=UPI003139DC37